MAVTNAGGGLSRWNGVDLTRWRDDATCDDRGAFCYLRDIASGHFWSTTHQPALQRADRYQAEFSCGLAEFRRRDGDIETHTTIAVAADDDVELRRVRVTNHAPAARTIEFTSYAEIVLASQDADAAHPAFAKLFVQTEWLREYNAILCKRRARDAAESTPSLFHLITTDGVVAQQACCESDRLRFIGRTRTLADPRAMHEDTLSGSVGAVLDPVVAIRTRIVIAPGGSATVDLITGVAATRDACIALAAKYQSRPCADQIFTAAPVRERARELADRAHDADIERYRQLAGCVMYANASLRADDRILARNVLGQSGLWRYSISGDLPIVLLRIAEPANIDLVRQMIAAHGYWRRHGLVADLVIVGAAAGDAQAPLAESMTAAITTAIAAPNEATIAAAIAAAIEAGGATDRVGQRGGIFVLDDGQLDDAGRTLLLTVARVVIDDAAGTLAQQLDGRSTTAVAIGDVSGTASGTASTAMARPAPAQAFAGIAGQDLRFGNGIGGFAPDGQAYVIATAVDHPTPAPWVNVIANPQFGTLISDSGSANTWSENAQAFRLTPWSNDPVGDANTEAFYIRDDTSGEFWSPTLLPCGGNSLHDSPYITRHGFGHSEFEHAQQGIESMLSVFVAIDAPVKFAVLKLCNRSGRARTLSVTGYVEWVLGDQREKTRMHVITARGDASGALFARNPYNADFADCTAFFDGGEGADATFCCDRAAFLGRNGTLRDPAAMSQPHLDGRFGAGLDPCAAIRVPCVLAAGESREIVFRLGAGKSLQAARELAALPCDPAAAHAALTAVRAYWHHTLGAVRVTTPDPALDVLVNGWLPYQVLSCRMWARNAFYQSSGAYGFRDQLQDAMALVHTHPALVREHLLRSASRQFIEGDVQHWWHPPSGRGVRTHCSDDYLWLPFAVCRYVTSTGDVGVLDEPVPFLSGNAPKLGESVYELPEVSAETANLYDHCVRAIEHGLRYGEHGLPLMGTCDWNDGMNLVGAGGKGESVWLGFFLYSVLAQFTAIAQRRDDAGFAQRCRDEMARLRTRCEASWDGEWYRRAYFDDGTPLGSAANEECRIDSIAQSWAVLSGAADPARARQAMDGVDRALVHRAAALIKLLDPPFDKSTPDPGYIKGYLPGVRENGAQYTHAAVWVAMAFAALGDAARAWQMFTLLNPVNHADSPQAIATYMTEPYVVASDVYAQPPHVGRGGWTWYTGAAGWMYRLAVESLLGLHVEADVLRVTPCMPAGWTSYMLSYRYRETTYRITVEPLAAGDGQSRVSVDGVDSANGSVLLVDDRVDHAVTVSVQPPSH